MQYDSDIYSNIFDFSNMQTLPLITPPDANKVDNSLLLPSNVLDHHDVLPSPSGQPMKFIGMANP